MAGRMDMRIDGCVYVGTLQRTNVPTYVCTNGDTDV